MYFRHGVDECIGCNGVYLLFCLGFWSLKILFIPENILRSSFLRIVSSRKLDLICTFGRVKSIKFSVLLKIKRISKKK